jgi:hypothetical protein
MRYRYWRKGRWHGALLADERVTLSRELRMACARCGQHFAYAKGYHPHPQGYVTRGQCGHDPNDRMSAGNGGNGTRCRACHRIQDARYRKRKRLAYATQLVK